MDQKSILDLIREKFSDSIIETHSRLGQDTVVIEKTRLIDLAGFLKEDPELKFNILADLTAVDYWKKNPRFPGGGVFSDEAEGAGRWTTRSRRWSSTTTQAMR